MQHIDRMNPHRYQRGERIINCKEKNVGSQGKGDLGKSGADNIPNIWSNKDKRFSSNPWNGNKHNSVNIKNTIFYWSVYKIRFTLGSIMRIQRDNK